MRYLKTEAGQLAFKQRSSELSARQRAAFILFDGQRPLDEVLASTVGLGVTRADILVLVEKGFLQAPVAQAETSAVPATALPTVPVATEPQAQPAVAVPLARPESLASKADCYRAAYPVATRITAKLGLRGFKLNLAIEAASGYDDLVALVPAISKVTSPEIVLELKQALQID